MSDDELMEETNPENEDTPNAGANRGGLTPEASRLYRVYKTVAAMLEKRGYMVPREIRTMSADAFTQKFGEKPTRQSLTILVVRAFL
mmetsp:Transcript_23501/g.35081  ORF Transcript_23501/g.35081 Transcript_23501/m.35081 type:complete len:87 (-) Transcript_23501:731-991(-)